MKVAAIVFAIINAVACFAFFVLILVFGRTYPELFYYLIFIIPSLLCSFAMIASINRDTKIVALGIVCIFFVGFPGGIFYLLWDPDAYSFSSKSHYQPVYGNAKVNAQYKKEELAIAKPVQRIAPEDAIKYLKKLYDLKILTKTQYEEKLTKYKAYISQRNKDN